ncbi:unnamed protein product [Linum trigynum]|uniref:Uncharacterized protein n=1 Tax=Linum trigynum TaxID=586398 RepID=A0AAV2DRF7_9ROSI
MFSYYSLRPCYRETGLPLFVPGTHHPYFSLLSFLIKLSALAIVGFAGATCTVSLRRGVQVGTLLFPSAFNLEGVMTGADCDISSGGISLTMLYIFS